MVKRVVTSIITVAVLMGVLVACGGSDSEVSELRSETDAIKAELAEPTSDAKGEDGVELQIPNIQELCSESFTATTTYEIRKADTQPQALDSSVLNEHIFVYSPDKPVFNEYDDLVAVSKLIRSKIESGKRTLITTIEDYLYSEGSSGEVLGRSLIRSPSLSPDGKSLAYIIYNAGINIMDLESGRIREYFPLSAYWDSLRNMRKYAQLDEIKWAPEGDMLYILGTGSEIRDGQRKHGIFAYEIPSEDLQPLYMSEKIGTEIVSFAISPDGNWVALVSNVGNSNIVYDSDESGIYEVFLLATGESAKEVPIVKLTGYEGTVLSVDWSPIGCELALLGVLDFDDNPRPRPYIVEFTDSEESGVRTYVVSDVNTAPWDYTFEAREDYPNSPVYECGYNYNLGTVGPEAWEHHISFSPDGNSLAFIASPLNMIEDLENSNVSLASRYCREWPYEVFLIPDLNPCRIGSASECDVIQGTKTAKGYETDVIWVPVQGSDS